MRKLISADIYRLRKNRVFWICMIAAFLIGAYNFCSTWAYVRKLEYSFERGLAETAFEPLAFTGLLIAVFCGLFLGSDFSSGTIRNKLAAGHTRRAVYGSALLTCMFAGLLLSLSYAAAVLLVGMPLLGFFEEDPVKVVYYAFCMFCVICVLSAFMILLVMQCASRSAGVVLGILLMFAMLLVSSRIENRLSEPKMNQSYTLFDTETYRPLEVEETTNPLYLEGAEREAWQWMHDILPMGQSIQISNLDGVHPLRWPVASAVLFWLITGAGIYLFRKKDLN